MVREWVGALISAVSTVGSAIIGSKGAKKAASTVANAQTAANKLAASNASAQRKHELKLAEMKAEMERARLQGDIQSQAVAGAALTESMVSTLKAAMPVVALGVVGILGFRMLGK